MARHKDFLLFLLGLSVIMFFIFGVIFQVHLGLVATLVGVNVVTGVPCRIYGGKGVAIVAALIPLSVLVKLPGLAVLITFGLPMALYAWRTKLTDERDDALAEHAAKAATEETT